MPTAPLATILDDQSDRGRVLGHEKLMVYKKALEFVGWSQSIIKEISSTAIVLDHLKRAAESVVENLANGNSRRSSADRNRYFDVSIGSALECAACLDICCRKMLLVHERQDQGKELLQHIVRMLIGLRASKSDHVKEETAEYSATAAGKHFFSHESLEVYQAALDLVEWANALIPDKQAEAANRDHLDRRTTSLALNIVEGNGRFSKDDQVRFLDIAHTSAIRSAACLDLLLVTSQVGESEIDKGKQILVRIISLLMGLRNAVLCRKN